MNYLKMNDIDCMYGSSTETAEFRKLRRIYGENSPFNTNYIQVRVFFRENGLI